jgi:hypothetical protein
MPKLIRFYLICCSLSALALCAFTAAARAGPINCPDYNNNQLDSPSTILAIVGTVHSNPILPEVLTVTSAASVANEGGTAAVVCTYTVQLTPKYLPPSQFIGTVFGICPSYPLFLAMTEPDSPPAAGFTAWAFSPSGPPSPISPVTSASQTVSAALLIRHSGRFTNNSCEVVNGGVFTFTLISTSSQPDICTIDNGSVTCVSVCPSSLSVSQISALKPWPQPSYGYYSTGGDLFTLNTGVLNGHDPMPSIAALTDALKADNSNPTFTLWPPKHLPGYYAPPSFTSPPGDVTLCSYWSSGSFPDGTATQVEFVPLACAGDFCPTPATPQ